MSKEMGCRVVNLIMDKIKWSQDTGQHSRETVGAGPPAVSKSGLAGSPDM